MRQSMKKCSVCKEELELKCFSKSRNTRDGLGYKCRDCDSKRNKEHRRRNLERKREYDRMRAKSPERQAQTQECIAKWRENNPVKILAHSAVTAALGKGELKRKPCEVCGTKKKVHAHHDDYSKPLEVRWLCSGHHSQWHAENGEAKNG